MYESRKFIIHPERKDTKEPHYRFYKILYTLALRLKFVPINKSKLEIACELTPLDKPGDRGRTVSSGSLTIEGESFDNLIFVTEQKERSCQLVSFWRENQKPDSKGSKGGAHPFAELAIEQIMGRVSAPTPEEVAALSNQYNTDPSFNVTTWLLTKWVKSEMNEPAMADQPLAPPSTEAMSTEYPPEIRLLNKWQSDVLRSGIPYTNYEVDVCVRNVIWDSNGRIRLEMHWEDGKFVPAADFGRYDLYSTIEDRKRVFGYLKSYDAGDTRARIILTLKGDSSDWTIASATMLKRLPRYIRKDSLT